MASKKHLESPVKVSENRELSEDNCSSSSEADAGESIKRRRVNHDYKKLSKLGYDPSVSTDSIHASSDTKGIIHFITILLNILACTIPSNL